MSGDASSTPGFGSQGGAAAAPSFAFTVDAAGTGAGGGRTPRRPSRQDPPLGPVPLAGTRAFLGIGRVDVLWVVVLFVAAMIIRAASPIFPDWLSHPFSGPPVTVGGLGFPYNGSQTDTVFVDSGSVLPKGGCKPGETAQHVLQATSETLCGFVFDEVYFPVDAAYDLEQPAHDYFDPEPPLTKLLMAPAINSIGFQPWSWRITCAIFGSLLCGLVYLIAMRLRRDRFFAACAGIFMCVDGLEIVESRTGVIDIIAIFFAVAAMYAFLLHWQARTRRQWTATLYMLALCLGLAFGAKLTAIVPLVVAAAFVIGRYLEPVLLRRVPGLRALAGPGAGEAIMWRAAAGSRAVLHYPLAALLACAVFMACYSRYLTIDHTVPNFLACSPETNLIADPGEPSLLLRHPTLSQAGRAGSSAPLPERIAWLLTDSASVIYDHTQASLRYHSVECRDHPYGSRWYTWPGLAHPVLFYDDTSSFTSQHGVAEVGFIENLGNPALWWLAIPALLFCAWSMTRGSTRLRVAALALLAVSLAILILVFHSLEKPAVTAPSGNDAVTYTVPIHGGSELLAAEALVALAGAVVVGWGAVAHRFVPAFIVLSFLVAWLMWMPGNEERVLFLYHMLGALPFVALGLAYALTAMRGHVVAAGTRYAFSLRPFAWAGLAVVLAAFLFFYQIWTGAPVSQSDHQMRMWFDSWFDGWS